MASINDLRPDIADRLLDWFEAVAARPQAERDMILDSALDILDPQPTLRPHSDAAKVAAARAELAALA